MRRHSLDLVSLLMAVVVAGCGAPNDAHPAAQGGAPQEPTAALGADAAGTDAPSSDPGLDGTGGAAGGNAATPAAGSSTAGAASGSEASAGASSAGTTGADDATAGTSGAGVAGADDDAVGAAGDATADPTGDPPGLPPFSFFVVSLEAMQRLSGSEDGFGGDLRYGHATGLEGADAICRDAAESSMPGASDKRWRAFLSARAGPDGMPVHAIARIGDGPWYDRKGRLVAENVEALLHARPLGGDPAIVDDLPNEHGVPNRAPDGTTRVDNHHILTGSDTEGRLFADDPQATCQDWTSAQGSAGRPRTGFSFPHRPGFDHWISAHTAPGCAPQVDLMPGPAPAGADGVGVGGGYGGIYCFALTP